MFIQLLLISYLFALFINLYLSIIYYLKYLSEIITYYM